jgi:hypothetical protein
MNCRTRLSKVEKMGARKKRVLLKREALRGPSGLFSSRKGRAYGYDQVFLLSAQIRQQCIQKERATQHFQALFNHLSQPI